MMMTDELNQLGQQARQASTLLAALSTAHKNRILSAMAKALDAAREAIKAENSKDLEAGLKAKLSAALMDRLTLDDVRIDAMIDGLRQVAALPDPVGEILEERNLDSALHLIKRRVPIGVIAIFYESRPNVTADVAALCLKTGNATLLRGGKEARFSNQIIASILNQSGSAEGLPAHAIQLVQRPEREAVTHMVQMTDTIDLAIPRGGEGLIRAVTQAAHIPVIKHYKGVCHVYVDSSADLTMAEAIILNAKCQRPGVCNAIETVLVHEDCADLFLPQLGQALAAKHVEIRGDETVFRLIKNAKAATPEDWEAEYLDLILAIKVVPSAASAIAHINQYGSHHSDAIITKDAKTAEHFLNTVDSAAVYHNASTRFTDGSAFGMGAEIGISTDKLHARGPMGLPELTTYKYQLTGTGQTR